MVAHTLTVTVHVRTSIAADGSPDDGATGVPMPPFVFDFLNACRYHQIDLPALGANARRAALIAGVAGVIASMPARLSRGFGIVTETAAGGEEPQPSRWDEVTGGWLPDPDGTAAVIQLKKSAPQGPIFQFPFKGGDPVKDGLATFFIAVQAWAV